MSWEAALRGASSHKYNIQTYDDIIDIFKSTSIVNPTPIKNYIYESSALFSFFKTPHSKQYSALVRDQRITACCLYEAVQYLKKAFLNFCAHNMLFVNGYITWSEVTNYYSSFFSLNGLMRLQGKAIIHLSPGLTLYLYPYEFENHSFFIERAKVKKSMDTAEERRFSEKHADIWREFYNHFKHFDYNRERFRNIYYVQEENEITMEVEKK